VIDDAKREKQLVVYSAARGNSVLPQIVGDFERRCGIEVKLEEARTEVMSGRIRDEQETKNVRGDVLLNGATAMSMLARERRFGDLRALPNRARVRTELTIRRGTVPVFVVPYGVLVSTRRVEPDAYPQRWVDLLEPRWREKILCDDMREIGAGGVLFKAMMDLYGPAYHRSLARLRPCFSLESRVLEQRVARGEFEILAPFTWPNIADLAGQPVAGYIPAEGAPYVQVRSGGDSPARGTRIQRVLFIDFLLSNVAQTAFRSRDFGATVEGIPKSPAYPEISLLATTDPTQTKRVLGLARRIYRDVPTSGKSSAIARTRR